MDNELTTVSQSKDLNLGNHKKVHWAYKLEEIAFFTPSSFECEEKERKVRHSVLKKLKIKARILKNLDICDDLLQKLQEILERIVERFSGNNEELQMEDLNDFNSFECEEKERKVRHSVLKKLKIKARILKNLDICDDLLQKLQEILERIVERFSGNNEELQMEDLNDFNRYWDELFELYGE
ncbi:hypothetical protein ACROYT_G036872 [Oculina patagonica]